MKRKYFYQSLILFIFGATLVQASPVYINLKSATGKWVSADVGGGGEVLANRDNALLWETFKVVDINGGLLNNLDKVNLMTYSGQNYLCAEGGGGGEINATRQWGQIWETFTITKVSGVATISSGAIITLKTYGGQYVRARNGGGGIVEAISTTAGTNEQFTLQYCEKDPGAIVGTPYHLWLATYAIDDYDGTDQDLVNQYLNATTLANNLSRNVSSRYPGIVDFKHNLNVKNTVSTSLHGSGGCFEPNELVLFSGHGNKGVFFTRNWATLNRAHSQFVAFF